MNKVLKSILKLSIGIIILAFLIYKVGVGDILESLKNVNVSLLIIAMFVPVPVHFLSTLNLHIFLVSLKKKVGSIYLLKCVLLAQTIGLVSFGRVGEFILVKFLNNKGVDYGVGLTITIIDRLISLAFLCTLAVVGSAVYFNINISLIFIIFIMVGVASTFFLVYSENLRSFLKRKILKSYSKYFKGFSKSFIYILKNKKKVIFANLIITIIKWIISFYGVYVLFLSFNQHVGFMHIAFVTSIMRLITLIPISFSGLGIKEGSGTYLYYVLANIAPSISMNVLMVRAVRGYIFSFFYYWYAMDLLEFSKKNKKAN